MAMYYYTLGNKIERKHLDKVEHFTLEEVKGQLKYDWQFENLIKNGKVKVRSIVGEETKNATKKAFKSKYIYKVEYDKRRMEYELWRKNPKGYYNCVTYFTNLKDKDKLIEEDTLRQMNLKKSKRAVASDDDI